MHTYKGLYDKCKDINEILAAIEEAAKHKHRRRDVERVLNDALKYAYKLQWLISTHSFYPSPYVGHNRKDGAKDKMREIAKPRFCYDQMMAHVLLRQLRPIIERSLYHHVYGSLEGKGQVQVKKTIEKWIRNDPKHTKYAGYGDVTKFYPSIDQDILSAKLHRLIKDEDFLIECEKFVRHTPKGIALGDPTSVWYGHLYLSDMDHYITALDGVDHYIRLMDDWVIFGANKKKLHRAMELIRTYMHENLHLRLKFNYQVFRMDWIDREGNHHGRFLDIDGFRFYRDRTTLRKSIMVHATRKAARISRKDCVNVHDARQMMSHLARMKQADVYGVYEERIKGKVNPKQLREKISTYDKKERTRWNGKQ
jgi:hypothetical protein